MQVYDFSNLNLQEKGNDNCYNCDCDNCDCDNCDCDNCDSSCDRGW